MQKLQKIFKRLPLTRYKPRKLNAVSENIFATVRKNLRKEAISKKITNESFPKFCQRVQDAFQNVSKRTVDNVISSMPKRINLVYQSKGHRINY